MTGGVTADTSSPATDTQDSTMKDDSPPQKGNADGVEQETAKGSSVHNPELPDVVPQHLVDLLGVVVQHTAQVKKLEACQIIRRPRLTSQQPRHLLDLEQKRERNLLPPPRVSVVVPQMPT